MSHVTLTREELEELKLLYRSVFGTERSWIPTYKKIVQETPEGGASPTELDFMGALYWMQKKGIAGKYPCLRSTSFTFAKYRLERDSSIETGLAEHEAQKRLETEPAVLATPLVGAQKAGSSPKARVKSAVAYLLDSFGEKAVKSALAEMREDRARQATVGRNAA